MRFQQFTSVRISRETKQYIDDNKPGWMSIDKFLQRTFGMTSLNMEDLQFKRRGPKGFRKTKYGFDDIPINKYKTYDPTNSVNITRSLKRYMARSGKLFLYHIDFATQEFIVTRIR